MNKQTQNILYRYGIAGGTLIAAVLITWGIFVLGTTLREDALTQAVKNVISNSHLSKQYTNISKVKSTNNFINFKTEIFTAMNKNQKVEVFVIPIQGKYGTFNGVFLYEEGSSIEFCGLISKNGTLPPSYYGISELSIEIEKQRIQQFKESNNEKK